LKKPGRRHEPQRPIKAPQQHTANRLCIPDNLLISAGKR
jgi:hypothetical protein